MGTHPIFESDFDCLTDVKMVLSTQKGIRSQYLYADVDGRVGMLLAYDDHPVLVELHRQGDTLYDPAFDGKLFETLFLIDNKRTKPRDQAREWWNESVELLQDNVDTNFHETLIKVAIKMDKLICIFAGTIVNGMRSPAWQFYGDTKSELLVLHALQHEPVVNEQVDVNYYPPLSPYAPPLNGVVRMKKDSFVHKLQGIIGNQKGLCRHQQGIKKPVPKPPQESKLTDDSYLANLVIYLINGDDEFKFDDEMLVDHIESKRDELLRNRPEYSDVEREMMQKTAELKKREVSARKASRQANLLKIMGLEQLKRKASLSDTDEVEVPAKKSKVDETKIISTNNIYGKTVVIELANVVGHGHGLLLKPAENDVPDGVEVKVELCRNRDFILELDHPNLFDNVRFTKKNVRVYTDSPKNDWLPPVAVNGMYHYHICLSHFPNSVPSDESGKLVAELADNEVYAHCQEFTPMVKRQWYLETHNLADKRPIIRIGDFISIDTSSEHNNSNCPIRKHVTLEFAKALTAGTVASEYVMRIDQNRKLVTQTSTTISAFKEQQIAKAADSDIYRLDAITTHTQGISATVTRLDEAKNVFEVYWNRDFILETDFNPLNSQGSGKAKSRNSRNGWRLGDKWQHHVCVNRWSVQKGGQVVIIMRSNAEMDQREWYLNKVPTMTQVTKLPVLRVGGVFRLSDTINPRMTTSTRYPTGLHRGVVKAAFGNKNGQSTPPTNAANRTNYDLVPFSVPDPSFTASAAPSPQVQVLSQGSIAGKAPRKQLATKAARRSMIDTQPSADHVSAAMPTRKTARKQASVALPNPVTPDDDDDLLIVSSDEEITVAPEPSLVEEEDEWCIMDTI